MIYVNHVTEMYLLLMIQLCISQILTWPRQINELFSWFCANKLSLNANKMKNIVIRPKHKKCDLNGLNISIDNIPLHRIGNDCDE